MQAEHIGVYAGIGPAASGDIRLKSQHLFQSRLHTGLYTDAVWLHLPAAVTAAVIFNCQQSPFSSLNTSENEAYYSVAENVQNNGPGGEH